MLNWRRRGRWRKGTSKNSITSTTLINSVIGKLGKNILTLGAPHQTQLGRVLHCWNWEIIHNTNTQSSSKALTKHYNQTKKKKKQNPINVELSRRGPKGSAWLLGNNNNNVRKWCNQVCGARREDRERVCVCVCILCFFFWWWFHFWVFLVFFSESKQHETKTEKGVMKRSTVGTKFPLRILELCKIDPFHSISELLEKDRSFKLCVEF